MRPALTAFGGSSAGRAGYATRILIGLNLLAALIGLVIAGLPTLIGNGLFTGVTKWQLLTGVLGPSVTEGAEGQLFIGAYPDLGTVYAGIDDGGIYRLVTAMFVHYGVLHLLMNMYALWFLGRQLELVLGPIRFVALYLLAGLGGNVAAYLWGGAGPTAGASTAIFGLFAAFFVILRRLGRDTSQVMTLLVVNLVLTFVIPGISWAGHIGGMVTGALVAVALAYAPQPRRTLIQVAGSAAVLVILAAMTLLGVLT